MPTDWWDDIKQLLGSSGQLLGNPTFQMAAGIPLAGFGAYELARGRPGGALLGTLGGLGTYFGEQGLQQQRDRAQKQKNILTQVKLLGQRPEFAGSKGLLQQIAGVAGKGSIGEVEGAEAQLNELIRHIDTQRKATQRPVIIGNIPFKPDEAGNLQPIPLPKGMKAWPTKAEAGGPEYLKHPLAAKLYAMGIDPDKASSADVDKAQKIMDAEKEGNIEKHIHLAASLGVVPALNPDGSMSYVPRTAAPGRETKGPKVPDKAGYNGAFDESHGIFIYTPKPPTGTGAGPMIGAVLGTSPLLRKVATLPGRPGKEYHKGDYIPGKGYWDGN